MVKAKAKPKAKPVVGRAGAQTPSARAKLASRGTPMRPTKPVGDRGMDARIAAKKLAASKANRSKSPAGMQSRTNKSTSTKPVTVKKSGTTDPFAKFVFGIGKTLRGGSNQGMTAAQVAAENKRRAAAAKRGK